MSICIMRGKNSSYFIYRMLYYNFNIPQDMKRNKSSTQQADLRKQREDKLMQRKEKFEADTEADSMKLLHELKVHKLELEMQNDELIQANQKAETISNKYLAFFDFAPMGYFTLNREGKIIELNYSAAAMIGKDRSVLVNRNFKSFISKDYREIPEDFLKRIFESGSKQSCEVKFIRNNNKSLFLHFEGIVSDTKNLCFVSVADITERKLAEETIQESEEKYRRFFDDALTGDFSMNDKGIIMDCNESFIEIFGFANKHEIIGKSITVLYQDASEFEFIISLLKRDKKFRNFEATRKRKDGELIHIVENKVASFDSQGNITEIKGYIYDITDRKSMEIELRKSEAKFRKILDLLPVGLSIMDKDYKVIDQNEALTHLMKLSKDEIESGIFKNRRYIRPDGSEVKPTDMPSYLTLNEKRNILDQEIGIYTETNELIWANVSTSYIEDIGVIVVTKDVTEQKQVFENLRQSEIRLRELNATKDKFFSIISHDLRGPFNSIIGYSDILGEQIRARDYDGIEEYANYIHDSSWRAMDLLTNLLEWSRSQSGRMEFKPENLQIAELIDATIETLIDASLQKSISIERDFRDNITAFADRAMIKTTLRNLISNAIKFTHPHGRIVISASKILNELLITVSDNGVGIDNNTLEKLFRIGESKSSTGTNKETGTGLGMLLCKEFVEKHGGRIWVESKPGKGSKFYFTLPC